MIQATNKAATARFANILDTKYHNQESVRVKQQEPVKPKTKEPLKSKINEIQSLKSSSVLDPMPQFS